jgi:structural maintenance of chromosomes protein 6
MKNRVTELNEKIIAADADMMRLEGEVRKNSTDQQRTKEAVDAKNFEITQATSNLHDLEKTKGDQLSVYNPRMSGVVADIEKNRNQFRELPVGPIGMSVKLKKEQWSSIIEVIFGKSLNGFIVSNYNDRNLLQQILHKRNW